MNCRRVLRFLASIVAILGLSLLSVSPVVASELILPPTFTHEGLTFEKPLEFTSGEVLPPVTLTFDEPEKIEVTVPPIQIPLVQQEVLAEQIVSPSPKKLDGTPATTLPTLAKVAEEIDATPTKAPTPTPTKVPTATPTPPTSQTTPPAPAAQNASLPAYATNGTLNADVLFSMANKKRSEAGLPAFEKHPDVCAVAESRKPEIENEVYGNSSIHAGFRARNLPWRATENMISQGTEAEAFSWWMNSSIHRAAIMGSAKYACVACQNKTCAMIFSSLEPK